MSSNQDDETPATQADQLVAGPGVPYLVVLNGPDVGRVYRLTTPESIIGRGRDANVCLSQESVSRCHARITLDGDRVVLEDLGSTNGTYLGVDLVRAPTVVPEGGNIGVGIFTVLRLSYSSGTSGALTRLGGTKAPSSGGAIKSRNHLLDLLRSERAYALRHQTHLTLVFVRADGLSGMCSENASESADQAMKCVGAEISSALRTEDFLARSACDEFTILTRGGVDAAMALAERLRSRIEARASLPTSSLAVRTLTAAVLPLRTTLHPPASGLQPRPLAPDDLLTAARTIAVPSMRANVNLVVQLLPLAL